MKKKKLKNGHVKCIDRDTLKVVVLGPKNQNGYKMEKKLAFHCLEIFENQKEQAFDYLRRLLVGKMVQFNDFRGKNITTADIFLDKGLVSYKLA